MEKTFGIPYNYSECQKFFPLRENAPKVTSPNPSRVREVFFGHTASPGLMAENPQTIANSSFFLSSQTENLAGAAGASRPWTKVLP
jgi:hypothetical protein